jgi:poly-beta-1,6-N-acetyl-D-glucosamine synthase
MIQVLFWAGIFCVIYTYAVYPATIALLARIRGNSILAPREDFSGSISVVLAVYNEEKTLQRRLDELCDLIKISDCQGEVIVVSDGSTDDTARIAKSHTNSIVRVLELPVNAGKAHAITRGCAAASGDIVVFADARQRWASDALPNLIRNFSNHHVGAVSGELVLEAGRGVIAGVGLYWKYEKWLRWNEGRVHSTVGVSGSISAVRKELFRAIPQGTLLDDLYWPMQVAMQGYRVIHDDRALAYDELPATTHDEFRRKVRTLTGNLQLLTLLPATLLPWRNPIWLQFVSHKLLRLVVPWALLSIFFTSVMLPTFFYRMALLGQFLFYSIGLAAILSGRVSRYRAAACIGSFIVLNVAAWVSFWVWMAGYTGTVWHKVRYEKTRT